MQETTNMQQEEHKVSTPYAFQPQYSSSAPVGVLDDAPFTQTPGEQNASQPPWYPTGPQTSPPPRRKRPGRGGAILLLTLVLALILGGGLFSGREFASGSRRTANTTSQTTATASATSSSGTTLEPQQEPALAKVQPAVVH